MYLDADLGNTQASSSIRFLVDASERARLRIDSGRLLVGTSSSPTLTDGQYAKIHLVGNTAGATGDSVLNLGRGLLASSGIAANVPLGILQFTDSAGAAHATIMGVTDAATGSNDYPGRLVFSTTADGASSPTERMRITMLECLCCKYRRHPVQMQYRWCVLSIDQPGSLKFKQVTQLRLSCF
jgi:hypothetical protein